ncbi:MAG TPA: TIGR03067 domain-containing protein [Gemmataceae bacterium]|nr:TIGR03067 domain-containing protein [Gemmataceae bacterium]
MSRSLIAFALLLSSLAAATAQDDAAKKDLAKMQGVWKIESAIQGGETIPNEITAKLTFTFKGNEVVPSDNPADVAKVTLDPSKKPPAFDLTEKNAKTSLGIYEIQGDTLKLCFNGPGEPRPTAFESAKGSKAVYFVLKRDKK